MAENLSGGTTNLLRIARSGCQSAVAFVALALGDQKFATATYPGDLGDGPPSAQGVEDLVRQLWLEPGLAQGKALVRTVQLGGHQLGQERSRLAVAALPLGTAGGRQPTGVLGVADPEVRAFGLPDLELLSRIAQRLTSYVKARQAVRAQLGSTAPVPPPAERPADTSAPASLGETFAAASSGAAVISGVAPGAPADPLSVLLGSEGAVPGLVPLGTLLGRAGRLLGAGTTAYGSLAVFAVTIEGVPALSTDSLAALVRSLRTDLRFDDLVASMGGLSFVAVVPLAAGAASSDQVEARLVDRAREAVASHPGAVVRAAHVVAPLSAGREADELLRAAVVKLRAA